MSIEAVSRFLVVLAGINIVCTVVLVIAAARYRYPALIDRAFVGVLLLFVAIGAAILSLRVLGFLTLNRDQVLVVLAGGLALISLPSIVWVIQLARGRFR